jgi:hypothetical protein
VCTRFIPLCHAPQHSNEGIESAGTPIDAVYLTLDLPLEVGTWISKIRSLGDHRSYIIEICWKALVGEDMFKIARPEAQRLSSTTYHSTTKYVRKLSIYVSQHKLMLKSHNLYKDTNGPLTQE